MIAGFFIERPIFASVISIVLVLCGGVAAVTLPTTQYPDITPPTIEGSAINARVRAVMAEVRRRAANGCGHCTVTVIAQGQPSEALLFPALVEDRGSGTAEEHSR